MTIFASWSRILGVENSFWGEQKFRIMVTIRNFIEWAKSNFSNLYYCICSSISRISAKVSQRSRQKLWQDAMMRSAEKGQFYPTCKISLVKWSWRRRSNEWNKPLTFSPATISLHYLRSNKPLKPYGEKWPEGVLEWGNKWAGKLLSAPSPATSLFFILWY